MIDWMTLISGLEVLGAILIFILLKPDHKGLEDFSCFLEGKQGLRSVTFA